MKSLKRLLGVGTRIQPITSKDVEAAPDTNPHIQAETENVKSRLEKELRKLELHSVQVRKLLASEVLELVSKPGKRT